MALKRASEIVFPEYTPLEKKWKIQRMKFSQNELTAGGACHDFFKSILIINYFNHCFLFSVCHYSTFFFSPRKPTLLWFSGAFPQHAFPPTFEDWYDTTEDFICPTCKLGAGKLPTPWQDLGHPFPLSTTASPAGIYTPLCGSICVSPEIPWICPLAPWAWWLQKLL